MFKASVLQQVGLYLAKLVMGVLQKKNFSIYKEEVDDLAEYFRVSLHELARRDRDARDDERYEV